jgi:IrrE N-terminal-like domain
MTPRTEKTLHLLASHFGLQIEYISDLPDNVSGFLQPGLNPRYIFVNANKPRCDQTLTIAHELAHYVIHFNRTAPNFIPWYLDYPWKSKDMIESSRETKEFLLQHFDLEWQADFWAFILLWQIGATDDLVAITELYPKKNWMFWYSATAAIVGGIKQRIKNFFQRG